MTTRTIAISGAASGIGRATAIRFAQAGWRVLAFDVQEGALDELRAAQRGIETFIVDVTDYESWVRALGAALGDTGLLHALINNAGILRAGRFVDLDPATHRAVMNVNVQGVMNGAQAAHPYLARAAHSVLVNIASAAAIYGQTELSSYAASKAAVASLTEALELEWQRDGIDVVAIWPLYARTPLVDGVDIASTRALGVRLEPSDVVDVIWRVVTTRSGRRRVHRLVGAQAKATYLAAKIAPAWLARLIAKVIASR